MPMLRILNKTGSRRTAFAVFGNLEITNTNPDCGDISCDFDRCTDPTIPGGVAIEPDSVTEAPIGDITFPCGSELQLSSPTGQVLLKWTDASPKSTCDSLNCNQIDPKCGFSDPIDIDPPIFVTASSECNGKDVDLSATVTSGVPPYDFVWKDKDGNIVASVMNTEETTFSAIAQSVDGQPYTVEVTDSDGCQAKDVAPDLICCSWSATCNDLEALTQEGCNADDAPDPAIDFNIVLATVADFPCGFIRMTSNDDVSGSICSPISVSRVYTVFDDVDGDHEYTPGEDYIECTQSITIQDTTVPELTVPQAATVECSPTECTDPSCPGIGMATATDTCDSNPNVGYTDVTTKDTTAPVVKVPDDATVECPECTTVECHGIATAVDDCSDIESIDYTDAVDNTPCGGTNIITRTWTATDVCGQTSTGLTQTITTVDRTPPVVTGCPSNMDLTCSDSVPAKATVSATDTCGGVETSYECCFVEGVLNRDWTFVDDCGNVATCEQNISIECEGQD